MRPILIATIGYIIGILWELYLNKSMALFLFFIMAIYSLYTKISLKTHMKRYIKVFVNKENFKQCIIFLFFFIFSIMHIKLLNTKYNQQYVKFKEEENIFLGTVVSDKKESSYYDIYTVKIKYVIVNNKKEKVNLKALVKVQKVNNKEMNYGDEIVFKGVLEEPNKRRNYKGFSYSEYLKSLSIYGTITSSYKEIQTIKNNNINIINRISNRAKKIIISNIEKILTYETKDIAIGILLGETENMNEDIKENFRTASLSHMLAVSGAHVSYIILGIIIVLKRFRLNKRISNIITIFILVFFMFLTGFTPSVTRACIMGICVISSEIVYRRSDFINSISIAALIILIRNPFSIYNAGMKMSFGGVIGIVMFQKNIKIALDKIINPKKQKVETCNAIIKYQSGLRIYKYKLMQLIKELLSVTISAQIIIIPITILEFNTISLTFFISNILATPFMGIITIGGFALVLISIISIKIALAFGAIYNSILELLIYIVNICSKIPGSKVYIITINIIIVIIYYIVVCFINYVFSISMKKEINRFEKKVMKLILNLKKIKIKKNKLIKYITICLIIIIIVNPIIKRFSSLKIYFVDVGQGDCTVIITPDKKNIVIDGGGNNTVDSSYDVGKSTLFPYLLDRKINKLDYIIISHFDSDHCKGLIYVLKNMKVKNAIIPKQFEENENYNEFIQIAKEKRINVIEVTAGTKIRLGKYVYMKVLWPIEEPISENLINNNSIVFKLYYKNFSAIFTGDIEKEAEEKILKLYKNTNYLKSTLLKVAHHGSKTSSTEEFLEAVKPQYAFIGVGEENKFGHPSEIVIERLQRINTKIFRTDLNGECIISINKGIKYKSMR